MFSFVTKALKILKALLIGLLWTLSEIPTFCRAIINIWGDIVELPNPFSKRLPEGTERWGEAVLCSRCRTMLSRQRVDSLNKSLQWPAWRHTRGLPSLEWSAKSGCQICIKILDWVESIEGDPGWKEVLQGKTLWGFSVRSQIWQTDVEYQYDLSFIILRHESQFGHNDAWRHEMRLKLIPIEGVRDHIRNDAIPPESRSEESVSLVRTWLRTCDRDHIRCWNGKTNFRPTRLIYVGGELTQNLPRLCISSTLPENIRYATLSHCWGTKPIFCLLTTNLTDLQEYLPMNELPQVFQDAIFLTRRIEVDYLWIDSLCILQNCELDWTTESATMGQVYARSYCNIAATGFHDGSSGLFIDRSPQKFNLPIISIPSTSSTEKSVPPGSYYCTENIWDDGVANAPLNKRAWAFQERFLSPRIVNFSSKQIFWECREKEACEMFPIKLPPPFATAYKEKIASQTTGTVTKKDVLQMWMDAVQVYTSANLTKEGDKLVALSGIAQKVHQWLQVEYLAGLWRLRLPSLLLWCSSPKIAYTVRRQVEYQGPSWSWVSINGRVGFVDTDLRLEPIVSILSHEVITDQQFGRVSSAYLRLRGYLKRAEWSIYDSLRARPPYQPERILDLVSPPGSEPLTFEISLVIDVVTSLPAPTYFNPQGEEYSIRDAIGKQPFFLLPVCQSEIGKVIGLVLCGTGVKGEFRRLGLFTIVDAGAAAMIAGHKPGLHPGDYEEFDAESGKSVLSIV